MSVETIYFKFQLVYLSDGIDFELEVKQYVYTQSTNKK